MRDELSNEEFTRYFQERSCALDCIPVLEVRPDPDAFLRLIDRHDSDIVQEIYQLYSGLIFTSKNAANVFNMVVAASDDRHDLPQIPCFVVGEGTASLLQRHMYLNMRGLSGDARSLLIDIKRTCVDKYVMKPLLYLAGARRRDFLPRSLKAEHIPFDEVVVYHTDTARPDSIMASMDRIEFDSEKRHYFVVFFSPTGVDASLDIVRKWFRDRAIDFDIVCIGPTTAEHLQNVYGFDNAAFASQPTPDSLFDYIASLHQE